MTKRLMAAAVAVLALAAVSMQAQAPPQMSPATAAAEQAATPSAPSPKGVTRFPPLDPKNFTADSPTPAVVDSFLKSVWGYDDNRVWQVAGILKTPAPGVVKVVVFLADKTNPARTQTTAFYVTPDGRHAISDQVIDFGAKPFAETRQTLQARADGPAMGAAGKDFLIVEFSDLQCTRCKDAQETIANLAADFPQARIVFQNLPLTGAGHALSERAAAEGVCVRKAKGDAAFFTYIQAVYSRQASLTADGAEATLATAATAAGADPAAVAACATTPAAKDAVTASVALATELGIDQTPTIVINGHAIQLGNLSYDTLKRIIAYQATQDGIAVHIQPTLSTLK